MTAGVYAMQPFLKEVLWGGTRLQSGFGKDAPMTMSLGETWEVSCLPAGPSQDVASGRPLRDLVAADPAHFLGRERRDDEFPLLVKLLCTKELLSLQVHPDDVAARAIEGLSAGKREAWFVLEAEPDAFVYLGLAAAVGKPELEAALRAGDAAAVARCVRRVPVHAGDVFDLAPGTLHALGPGVVLLEVQQPSDVTYRVFDWGRVDADGRPRPLHLDKALAVLDPTRRPGAIARPASAPGAFRTVLVQNEHFRIEAWRIDGERRVPVADLMTLTCVGGAGEIRSPSTAPIALARGQSVVVAKAAGEVRLAGRGLDLAVAVPAGR